MGFFSWVSDVAESVADTVSDVAETVGGAVSYAVQNPGRALELVGQGLVQGAARGVAGLGDLAVSGVNLVAGTEYNLDLAGRAQRAVTWTEAQNEHERALLSAGRGIGEVGIFIVPGVGAAGLAGLGAGALSGTARATAVRYMANTARVIVPSTRTGVAVDATLATGMATLDYMRETEDFEIATEVLESTVSSGNERLQELGERQDALVQEFRDVESRLEQGGLSPTEEQNLMDRREEIREGVRIIIDITQGNYETPEEEQRQYERLNEIQPISAADPADRPVYEMLSANEGGDVRVTTGDFAETVAADTGSADIQWRSPELAARFGGDVLEHDAAPVREIQLA